MGKIGQPAILGEIFAGILRGPTVLGHFRPQWYSGKFPTSGALPIVFKTVTTLGVVFFLIVVGLENSLRFRRGKSELFGSSFGVIFPFVGFIVPALSPIFWRCSPEQLAPPRVGNIVPAAFTPELAKHSKSFSLIDCISVAVDRMQRNFRWRPGRDAN